MTDGASGDEPGRQISIEDARKMLGMIARNYSDEELSELLHCLYGIAEAVYDDLQNDEPDQ